MLIKNNTLTNLYQGSGHKLFFKFIFYSIHPFRTDEFLIYQKCHKAMHGLQKEPYRHIICMGA